MLEVELQRIEMRVPKPLMPEPEPEANGDCKEDEQEDISIPLKSVKLESPEVD